MIIFFVLYLALLLVIGWVASKSHGSSDEYLISNRKVNGLFSALSSESTGMSGWLLLGLPGQIFTKGLSAGWAGWSCILGTFLNWRLIAPRVQKLAHDKRYISLVDILSHDDNAEPSNINNIVRYLSSIGIIFFMTIYTWAQFVALGKALSLPAVGMGLSYESSVIFGGITIIAYSSLGGFKSVVWTDVLQAIIMACVFIIVPAYLILNVSDFDKQTTLARATASGVDVFNVFQEGLSLAFFMTLLSGFGIGAAYTGQPQLVSRYIATRSRKDIRTASWAALFWVILATVGVAVIGVISHFILDSSAIRDSELIIFEAAAAALPMWLYVVVAAGVAAAIMSSADSFLMASATSLSNDVLLIKKFSKKLNNKTIVPRFFVIFVGVFSLCLAYNTDISISDGIVFKLASYAWGGLAIAFGVPLIYKLFSIKPRPQILLLIMLVGVIANVLWQFFNWSAYIYEVIPIMILQLLTWFIASKN